MRPSSSSSRNLVGEKAQHCEPDEVRVGRIALHGAEHGLQRETLRTRQRVHGAQEWEHELVHAREAKSHLRLNPGDEEHLEIACRVDRVAKQ